MAYKRRLKNKKPPEGWELIEEVVEDFEAQVRVSATSLASALTKRAADCLQLLQLSVTVLRTSSTSRDCSFVSR